MKRDLYEKQRVDDEYLMEHQSDNKMLNSCYQNTYFKAKLNKFVYFIYASVYDPKDLRFHYMVSWLTTGAATAMLAAINPFLPLALLYDYYLLLGFTKVLN